jgi:hypothetical protein
MITNLYITISKNYILVLLTIYNLLVFEFNMVLINQLHNESIESIESIELIEKNILNCQLITLFILLSTLFIYNFVSSYGQTIFSIIFIICNFIKISLIIENDILDVLQTIQFTDNNQIIIISYGFYYLSSMYFIYVLEKIIFLFLIYKMFLLIKYILKFIYLL